MKLSQHDLRQLDDGYLQRLPEAALRALSLTLLADLKEAQERLQQNPNNSSRPPSSRAPWDRPGVAAAEAPDTDEEEAPVAPSRDTSAADDARAADDAEPAPPPPGAPPSGDPTPPERPKRKPGKQPGTPGVGRTQVFTAQATEEHRPTACHVCQASLAAAAAVCYTGFQSLDLVWGDPKEPGVRLRVVDHRFFEAGCDTCGHHTREQPMQVADDPTLEGVQLREWRLVGPGLATLIVALSLRFRLSRARIHEFLDDWLGVHLSIGTIHQTLHEAAAVVAPVEATLLADI
ncbi:DUF6444 domain-containing protein, partial [uncultured Lamprocystis sp.]